MTIYQNIGILHENNLEKSTLICFIQKWKKNLQNYIDFLFEVLYNYFHISFFEN